MLQAAAVVGARFWPGAVAAALGTGADAVERALRTLAQRDLVREQPDSTMADEPEYRFRHVLVSDVCYERLPTGRDGSPATSAPPTGSTPASTVAAPSWPRSWPTTGTPPTRPSVALGLDPRPYAASALAALRHAARRAAMLNAFDAAATHVARADQLVAAAGRDGSAPGTVADESVTGAADRLGVELLGIELALHQDSTTFLTGSGPDRLAELATLLYRARDHGGAARAWTLLGQIAWLRADRTEALRCLDRAVELFDDWPDTPEKAQAYAELGRLHMLNYEHAPALGATQIAAEIAERLGLVELRANALITIGMCRYQAGEPDGLVDLQEALEFCRTHQLPSLRRATQHVAYALREEGDPVRSEWLLNEGRPSGDASFDAMQALFAGDWDRFFALADSILETPTAELDLQIRGVRGWMRALRGDETGAAQDTTQALTTARASGFWRLKWTALAHGALCEALLDKRDRRRGHAARTRRGLATDAHHRQRRMGRGRRPRRRPARRGRGASSCATPWPTRRTTPPGRAPPWRPWTARWPPPAETPWRPPSRTSRPPSGTPASAAPPTGCSPSAVRSVRSRPRPTSEPATPAPSPPVTSWPSSPTATASSPRCDAGARACDAGARACDAGARACDAGAPRSMPPSGGKIAATTR